MINSCNLRVSNKLVKWKNMTVVWHIDDRKVSHMEGFELTKFFQYFSMVYEWDINVNSGNIHDYLGMYLD